MNENLQIVPKNTWYDATQDTISCIEGIKTKTPHKKYPKLWKVADTYTNVWKDNGWYGPTPGKGSSKNITNFKPK